MNKNHKKKKSEDANAFNTQELYLNRELSWLSFNHRVLSEAKERTNPLMERLNFLSITCSNLDEFFMVRVASLKDLVDAYYDQPDPSGLTPREQLAELSIQAHRMIRHVYQIYNRSLRPALKKEQIEIIAVDHLNAKQIQSLKHYFLTTVHPVLTPVAVDVNRPFPLINNQSLHLYVTVDYSNDDHQVSSPAFALIEIPSVLPRLILLKQKGKRVYVLLESLISLFLDTLFSGVCVKAAGCFRILRNADLDIDEDDAADLLIEIEKQLKQRRWGQVIRLECEDSMESDIVDQLTDELNIAPEDVYSINGPLDLTCLDQIYRESTQQDLFYPEYKPQPPSFWLGGDLFQAVRERDLFLHHPYEVFDPVIEWVRQAAQDPGVLAIKQTLYRISGQSPIVQSLAEAAQQGKQVMVLVELRARFDEANNILWARRLEQAGCHVIYGVAGFKTHSKITLIVRRDADRIRQYCHLSTGNYNDVTAKIYSDMSLLTCSDAFGREAADFFHVLSGYAKPQPGQELIVAPYWMRSKLKQLIDQVIKSAQAGKPSRIIIKANSLVDPMMIHQLYRASQAGVSIDLIIRGICCLRPAVKGFSENIRVRSIIGRFLEHSRVFYFLWDDQESIYLSSADWMPRNLDRRIELMFPIHDPEVFGRVMDVLKIQLLDTERAWEMRSDGRMKRVDKRGKKRIDCQQYLCDQAIAAARNRKSRG